MVGGMEYKMRGEAERECYESVYKPVQMDLDDIRVLRLPDFGQQKPNICYSRKDECVSTFPEQPKIYFASFTYASFTIITPILLSPFVDWSEK